MNFRKSIYFNLILISLILLSIFFIDKPISTFIAKNLSGLKPFFFNFTDAFDRIFYHIIWLIIFFAVFGVVFFFNNRTRKVSFALLTVLFTVIGAYGVITANLKTELKRARPEVYLSSGEQSADFFNEQTKDYSFPSSHAAFYLSFFLPFALTFRRYAHLILIIPVIIAAGRVFQNVHYLSDVLCSILIVFNFCLLSFWLLHQVEYIWVRIKPKRRTKNDTDNRGTVLKTKH
jgi:membrane-associated phospholipid phosphatase